jgi:hypothetical protein
LTVARQGRRDRHFWDKRSGHADAANSFNADRIPRLVITNVRKLKLEIGGNETSKGNQFPIMSRSMSRHGQNYPRFRFPVHEKGGSLA